MSTAGVDRVFLSLFSNTKKFSLQKNAAHVCIRAAFFLCEWEYIYTTYACFHPALRLKWTSKTAGAPLSRFVPRRALGFEQRDVQRRALQRVGLAVELHGEVRLLAALQVAVAALARAQCAQRDDVEVQRHGVPAHVADSRALSPSQSVTRPAVRFARYIARTGAPLCFHSGYMHMNHPYAIYNTVYIYDSYYISSYHIYIHYDRIYI